MRWTVNQFAWARHLSADLSGRSWGLPPAPPLSEPFLDAHAALDDALDNGWAREEIALVP